MKFYNTKILYTSFETHNVKRFILEKPEGYEFNPGQYALIAIDTPELKEETRPFSFTSSKDDSIIEFTIKSYPEHNGVTARLHQLEPGSRLLISEPRRMDAYQGPGLFIAGGTGITPFLSILRGLSKTTEGRKELEQSFLLFSNRTERDIIAQKELNFVLGKRARFIITEPELNAKPERINEELISGILKQSNLSGKPAYLCGPPGFVEEAKKMLISQGVNEKEIFLF